MSKIDGLAAIRADNERLFENWREEQALVKEWQQHTEAAEAEIADLRQQLAAHDAEANAACLDWDAKYRELEQRLAAAEALVPEAKILQRLVSIVKQKVFTWPQTINFEQTMDQIDQMQNLAAAIRDWRKEQGREGESDNDA